MLIRLLRHRSIGLSPEAKFFLLRFLQEEQKKQVDTLAALNVRTIAKRIGVTPKVAGAAIEQLVSLGLLTKQSKLRQLGRPSSEYSCSTLAVEKFLGSTVDNPEQESRVAKLLGGASEQKEQRLMYANRLLLAVLVAQADEFGVVRKLGWRDLAERTGLRREVLRQRLGWLLEQGYLRSVIPGVTGIALFKKAKSEYILNLAHPFLCVGQAPGLLVVRTKLCRHIDEYPARQILNAIMKCGGQQLVQIGHERYDIGKFFGSGNLLHLTPILQASIDRYASYLLSEQSEVLDEDIALFSELRARIRQDFILPDIVRGEGTTATMQVDIVHLLCSQSVEWARDIKAAISTVNGLPDQGEFKYWLLPASKRDHSWRGRRETMAWALLVKTSLDALPYGCRVHDAHLGVDHALLSDEELALGERYFYGLLTEPKSVTVS
ncbi:MAG: hypothetical protein CVV09_20795 [Gammaproteobacteria bacterium HGW-Gammaproteobacteria-13]|nr:MAG: hypothetical protein CVV09_20795 [Gammaproteobacteria bacterium HGW-Gammaproteobacteria-13]